MDSRNTQEEKWGWVQKNTGIERQKYIDALGMDPRTGYATLTVGNIHEDSGRIILYHHQIHEIQYVLTPLKGEDKYEMYLDRIDLRGVGHLFFQSLLAFGEDTGLFTSISLHAGKEGPYIWPKYGFLPSQREWDSLRSADHRLKVNVQEIKKNCTSENKDSILARIEGLLNSSDPTKIRDLAQMDDRIELRNGSSWKAGQRMLHGDCAKHYATFDLTNKDSREQFKNYAKQQESRQR